MSYIDKAMANVQAKTVDLSKAVKGSKVYFRCGGHAHVKSITILVGRLYADINLNTGNEKMTWFLNGTFGNSKFHPFDIIRIEPPEFNWDEVKPGMAFYSQILGTVYYIGKNMNSVNVFETSGLGNSKYDTINNEQLIRMPEYDEVQS